MNKPLLSENLDEIIFAFCSLHQPMFWDETAASVFEASWTGIITAELARVAVKTDVRYYFTTFMAVDSMVEVNVGFHVWRQSLPDLGCGNVRLWRGAQ